MLGNMWSISYISKIIFPFLFLTKKPKMNISVFWILDIPVACLVSVGIGSEVVRIPPEEGCRHSKHR